MKSLLYTIIFASTISLADVIELTSSKWSYTHDNFSCTLTHTDSQGVATTLLRKR